MTRYYTAWFCSECDHELTLDEVLYSHGRCPHCAFKGKYAGTIVNNKERPYYLKRIAPWWKFWTVRVVRVFTFKSDDENDKGL